MELIKCYIDNFGRLSDKEIIFKAGLNEIREDNGSGKSTLASFIKAMLFGLPDTKSQKLEENERRKFEPWQGGIFGGSLEFEAGGIRYRIERTFSKKANDDSCKIFNAGTGKLLAQGDEEIGRTIFGIDREGFERTVFLSDKSFGEKNENPSIAAKLSDLSGVSFDLPALKSALDVLEEQRKFYHKQSGSGAIDRAAEERSELELKMRELTELAKKHENDARCISALKRKQAALYEAEDKTRSEKEKDALAASLMEQYREKEARLSREKASLEEIKSCFPNGVPTQDDISELAMLEREKFSLSSRLSAAERESSSVKNTKEKLLASKNEAAKIIERKSQIDTELEQLISDTGAPISARTQGYILSISLSALSLILGILLGVLLTPLFFALAALSFLPMLMYCVKIKYAEKKLTISIKDLDEELLSLDGEAREISKNLDFRYTGIDGLIESIEDSLTMIDNGAKQKNELSLLYRNTYCKLTEIYAKYESRELSELKTKLNLYESQALLVNTLENELRLFKEKYQIDGSAAEPCEGAKKLELITDELKKTSAELSVLSGAFLRDERELEEQDELSAKIEALREREERYTESFKAVKLAKKYLELARDEMNSRYLEKTMSSFKKYTDMISDERGDFGMDTSFVITRHEGGQSRPRNAYSKGTRELYELALRLSLTDALYEGEKPFIILDDPFAYFDDKKLCRAKKMLLSIAKESQIIYLTPSEARCVN